MAFKKFGDVENQIEVYQSIQEFEKSFLRKKKSKKLKVDEKVKDKKEKKNSD